MTRIGVFADPHYARGKVYGSRYCALSLRKLERIVKVFNERKVELVVCLGDLIDSQQDEDEDVKNILAVKKCLEKLDAPLHIVVGNHDLEAMSKERFLQVMGGRSECPYYSFDCEDSNFVVLDANNKENEEYDSGNFDWADAHIDEVQIEWLRKTIRKSECDNVVVFVHQNLDERAGDGETGAYMVKNASDIRGILQNAGQTVTVVQGHYHDGFDQVIEGIRYVTLRAVCEGSDIDSSPFKIISIDEQANVRLL